MHLNELTEALDYRIVGGSEYCWSCFPDARFLDFESEHAHVSCIFDTVSQVIYEVSINDKPNKYKPYRWLNPAYKDDYLAEAKEKNVDTTQAWDDVKWVELEIASDFLDKATAIFFGDEFDDRVQVPLDLGKDELFKLMEMAHEQDITLNQLVEKLLTEVINKEKLKEFEEDYSQDFG